MSIQDFRQTLSRSVTLTLKSRDSDRFGDAGTEDTQDCNGIDFSSSRQLMSRDGSTVSAQGKVITDYTSAIPDTIESVLLSLDGGVARLAIGWKNQYFEGRIHHTIFWV